MDYKEPVTPDLQPEKGGSRGVSNPGPMVEGAFNKEVRDNAAFRKLLRTDAEFDREGLIKWLAENTHGDYSIQQVAALADVVISFDGSSVPTQSVSGSEVRMQLVREEKTGLSPSSGSILNVDSGSDKVYDLYGSGSVDTSIATPSGNAHGVVIDSSSSLWLSDSSTNSVYKTNLAGSVIDGFSFIGGAAQGVDVDENGCVWVADEQNNGLYKLNQSGSEQARFYAQNPKDVSKVENSEYIDYVNGDSIVRRDYLDTFYPDADISGADEDSNQCIWLAGGNSIYKFDRGGNLSSYSTSVPGISGLGIDGADCIWVSSSDDATIFELDRGGGVISSFTSPSDSPVGLGVDSSNCLWFSEPAAGKDTPCVYQVDRNGNAQGGFTACMAYQDVGIGVDSSDCIWIGYKKLGTGEPFSLTRVDQSGSITDYTQTSLLYTGIGFDSNDSLLLGNYLKFKGRVLKEGKKTFDFASREARLTKGYYEGLGGNYSSLVVSDSQNSQINKLSYNNKNIGYAGSYRSNDVDFDSNNCLWFSENTRSTIYKTNTKSIINSFFFNSPDGIAFDSNDCLWTASSSSFYKTDQTTSVVSTYSNPTPGYGLGLAFDESYSLWVTRDDSLYKLDSSLNIAKSFSGVGRGVTFDSNNCLWTSEKYNACIVKKDRNDGSSLDKSFRNLQKYPLGIVIKEDAIWQAGEYSGVKGEYFYSDKTASFSSPSSNPEGVDLVE